MLTDTLCGRRSMWPLQMQWDAPAVAMRVVKMCSSIPSVHLCPALVPIVLFRSLSVPLTVCFICCYGYDVRARIYLVVVSRPPRPLTHIPILIRPCISHFSIPLCNAPATLPAPPSGPVHDGPCQGRRRPSLPRQEGRGQRLLG